MSTVARMRAESVGSKWSLTEANELYDVERWGQGYFSINEHGHLQVHPTKDPARGVDLKRLVSATFPFDESPAAFVRAAEARPSDVKLQIYLDDRDV